MRELNDLVSIEVFISYVPGPGFLWLTDEEENMTPSRSTALGEWRRGEQPIKWEEELWWLLLLDLLFGDLEGDCALLWLVLMLSFLFGEGRMKVPVMLPW